MHVLYKLGVCTYQCLSDSKLRWYGCGGSHKPPLSWPLRGPGESHSSMPPPVAQKVSQHWDLRYEKLPLLLEQHCQAGIGHMGEHCWKYHQALQIHHPNFHIILHPSLFGFVRTHKTPYLSPPLFVAAIQWGCGCPYRILWEYQVLHKLWYLQFNK